MPFSFSCLTVVRVSMVFLAKRLMDNFAEEVLCFKKIMPIDYNKMILAISGFEEKGMPREEAEMEAFYKITRG